MPPYLTRDMTVAQSQSATAPVSKSNSPEAQADSIFNAWNGYLERCLKLRDDRIAALTREVDELKASAVASLERRASRHAEHLGRLEDRLRSLEGK